MSRFLVCLAVIAALVWGVLALLAHTIQLIVEVLK